MDAPTSCSNVAYVEQSSAPLPGMFGRVASAHYRAAVAQIAREIMAEYHLDEEQLAQSLGCSKSTVKNALKQQGNMDPVTMLNFGAIFGGERRIRRILALINGAPVEKPTLAERTRRIHAETDAIARGDYA